MGTPKIPINQQDALPLLTTDAASLPGDIQLVGNSLTRYWSPSVLGMGSNFVAIPNGGASFWMRSNVLDVRGCCSFALLIKRSYVVGGDVQKTVQAYVLYQFSDGTDEDLVVPNNYHRAAGNDIVWGVGAQNPNVATVAWRNSSIATTGCGAVMATVGTRVRVALRSIDAVNANQTYSCELYGSSS